MRVRARVPVGVRVRVSVAIGLGAALVLVGPVGTGLLAPAAGAVSVPGWCGGSDETATDRPDVVGGNQIHVVYAHAADVPDRFAQDAPKIVRDLAGVDAWWRRQDPTRTPRFDFAAYPFCDSKFGTLDISSVQLPSPNATYRSMGDEQFADQVGRDVAALVLPAAGSLDSVTASQTANTKKYLVYLDAADALVDKCGFTRGDRTLGGPAWPAIVLLQPTYSDRSSTCDVDRFGAGNGWTAVTAVHELVHTFDQIDPVRPHACLFNPAHVCDSPYDLMVSKDAAATGLDEVTLDVGHDDYYETPGPQYDVRTSQWLAHLDAPQLALTVSVEPASAGTVHESATALPCTDSCRSSWDGGSAVSVWEAPAPGYSFDGYTGACGTTESICTATLSGDTTVVAHFVRLVDVPVVVKGSGRIVRSVGGNATECRGRCAWPLPTGGTVEVVAHAGRHARFARWTGTGCRGTRPACTFVVSGRSNPVAVFSRS